MSDIDFDSNKYKLRYEYFSETELPDKVFCLPCQKVMLKSSRAPHSKSKTHYRNIEKVSVSQPIDTPSGRTDKVGIPKKSKKVQPKVEKKVPKVKPTEPTKKGKVEVEKKPKLEKKAPVKKKQVVVEQEVESEEESSEESESEESESDFSEESESDFSEDE